MENLNFLFSNTNSFYENLFRFFGFSISIYGIYILYVRLKSLSRIYVKFFGTNYEIKCKKSDKNNKLISKLGDLNYIPYFLFPHSILQGAIQEFLPCYNLSYKREYIFNEKDNGIISLDWLIHDEKINGFNKNNFKNLMIFCHGLSGGSEQVYSKDIALEFGKNGYSVVIIHARGINDTPLGNPKVFHAGFTIDVEYSIEYILKTKGKFDNIFLIGTSMGANISYRAISYNKELSKKITGYVNISNPFDMIAASKTVEKTVFDWVLIKNTVDYFNRHKDILSSFSEKKGFCVEKVSKSNSMKCFDAEYTVKSHGFKDVDDYYFTCGSSGLIENISNTRALFLVSEDDPIVHMTMDDEKKSNYFLILLVEENEKHLLIRTKYGGHIGWYQGIFYPNRWFTTIILNFCNAVIEEKKYL